MNCNHHLCENKLTGKQTRFCCGKCKSNYHTVTTRKRRKLKAITYKGGKCCRCGYNKSVWALEFHHLKDKEFGIGKRVGSRAWATVKKELDKCLLLCANCHAELHEEEYAIRK